MTKRRLKIWNGGSTPREILTALLVTTLSASGCAHDTPNPIRLAPETAFCERYYDAEHPPVWIYESDSPSEKEEKTDLLILWERECEIRAEV